MLSTSSWPSEVLYIYIYIYVHMCTHIYATDVYTAVFVTQSLALCYLAPRGWGSLYICICICISVHVCMCYTCRYTCICDTVTGVLPPSSAVYCATNTRVIVIIVGLFSNGSFEKRPQLCHKFTCDCMFGTYTHVQIYKYICTYVCVCEREKVCRLQ